MSILKLFFSVLLFAVAPSAQAAIDSYSFFHVTIETPWMIFLFLCVFVLAPFVLMAVLYWHFAIRRHHPKHRVDADPGRD